MKKTKIICTLGPSTTDPGVLSDLVQAGMNVVRLNMSHADRTEHKARIDMVRRISREQACPIGIMLDVQGPKIRTGDLSAGVVYLKENDLVDLTADKILGDARRFSVGYPRLYEDLRPGTAVMIDDGMLELEVLSISPPNVTCRVVTGGRLKSRKGVNFRNVNVDLPTLTDKDVADIQFGVENGVEFFAISFVRSADDVKAVKRLLAELCSDAEVVAKIENLQGVANLDEILSEADAVMVARGDLGIEAPPEDVPVLQKMIIEKCNDVGKPVITATQMLDSMQRSPLPTRAEVTDVSNAIMQGSDAVMLSGETAVGEYPVATVKMMTRIALRAERELPYELMLSRKRIHSGSSVADAICHATCVTAEKLGLTAILSSTNSGSTARIVSKYRPRAPIIATTPQERVARKLTMVWGVTPVVVDYTDDAEGIVETSVRAALNLGFVSSGDLVVVTAGIGTNRPGRTNFIKVHRV